MFSQKSHSDATVPCSIVKDEKVVFMHKNRSCLYGYYFGENRPGSAAKIVYFYPVTAETAYVYFTIEKSTWGVLLFVYHAWHWAPAILMHYFCWEKWSTYRTVSSEYIISIFSKKTTVMTTFMFHRRQFSQCLVSQQIAIFIPNTVYIPSWKIHSHTWSNRPWCSTFKLEIKGKHRNLLYWRVINVYIICSFLKIVAGRICNSIYGLFSLLKT